MDNTVKASEPAGYPEWAVQGSQGSRIRLSAGYDLLGQSSL